MNFKLTYDSFTLKVRTVRFNLNMLIWYHKQVYINGTLKLSRNVSIYPRYYYGGFSGSTDTSLNYMTQQIWNWTTSYLYPQPTQFSSIYESTFASFGSGSQNFPMLKLTNGYLSNVNAGAVVYPTPLTMSYGFLTYIYWNASNCDVNGGGDGYVTFHLSSIGI